MLLGSNPSDEQEWQLGKQRNSAVVISALYIFAGAFWILFSDLAVAMLFTDAALAARVSLYKGWFYVAVTAYLLYLSMRKAFSELEHSQLELRESAAELESTYEELAAIEEELRQQYEALQISTTALARNEEQYRTLFEHMFDAFALHEIICDENGKPVNYRFLAVNSAFERITGLKAAEIIGKTVLAVLPETERSWIEMYGRVALTGEPLYATNFSQELDRYYTVKAYSPEAGRFAVLFLDVTEQKQHENRLEYLAYHDELTGLPNRRKFNKALSQTLQKAKQRGTMLAILLIELAHYKLVNDIAGHKAGEQLLRDVAERLAVCVREGDMVARMVGNEFTVLLPDIDSVDEINVIAQGISEVIRKPWVFHGQEFFLAANIGVSMYPFDGEDADTLMKRADMAGHRAQTEHQEQGDIQYFIPAIESQILERNQMENHLRYALERDELMLYYQAQVNMQGEIIGMEALLRWQHPTKGLVMPGEFIALAEETGLIIPIGEWVLQAACKQSKEWQAAGHPPVRISVNLSPLQFQQKNLVEVISAAVAAADIDPALLELEITETTAMYNTDYTLHVLNSLKQIGIKISLDDFGKGNSSLIYLKRFPINTLKVDRSFVQDILQDVNDRKIVKTIINLAQNLNLTVVAEGVEQDEQFEILKTYGCDFFQGYLFSRPLPSDKAAMLFTERVRQETSNQFLGWGI